MSEVKASNLVYISTLMLARVAIFGAVCRAGPRILGGVSP